MQQCSSAAAASRAHFTPSDLRHPHTHTPSHPHTPHTLTLISRRKRRSVVASTQHQIQGKSAEMYRLQDPRHKTSTVVARVHSPQSTVLIPDDARVPAVPARIKYWCWLYVWKTGNRHMVYDIFVNSGTYASCNEERARTNEMAIIYTIYNYNSACSRGGGGSLHFVDPAHCSYRRPPASSTN